MRRQHVEERWLLTVANGRALGLPLLGWLALVVGIGFCLIGVTVGVVTTDSKWAACRDRCAPWWYTAYSQCICM